MSTELGHRGPSETEAVYLRTVGETPEPDGRLVADVEPLLAEVERLRNSLEACRNAKGKR